MSRPRILDLFCGAGGAAMGYHRAGFDVVGVDLNPQPDYPFAFVWDDALEYMHDALKAGLPFDAIHASPPCQAYSKAQRLRGNTHPDLIAPTRVLLERSGLPYVIENVGDAVPELRNPVMLCGAMFGLRTYRHRYFETSFPILVPADPPHVVPQAKMGRPPKPHEFIQCVGNFSGVEQGREAMGMPWANRDGLREAIPPAYAEFIGSQFIEYVGFARAAA